MTMDDNMPTWLHHRLLDRFSVALAEAVLAR